MLIKPWNECRPDLAHRSLNQFLIRCRRMRTVCCLACGMLVPGVIIAARLPLRHYTTADGLANGAVNSIASDPRGFLWFGTNEGLSRFDGYTFSNLTTADGLPGRSVDQVMVGEGGDYWLVNGRALVRYRPALASSNPDRIKVFRAQFSGRDLTIYAVLKDHAQRIWCATHRGVYLLDAGAANPRLTPVDFGLAGKELDFAVHTLTEDQEGSIWAGMVNGMLHRRRPGGQLEHYSRAEGLPAGEVDHMLTDHKGRIWVATTGGVYRLIRYPRPGTNIVEYSPGKRDGMPGTRVYSLFESHKGDIWAGMFLWVGKFPADGGPPRTWNEKDGLPRHGILSVGEDQDGNLWLGGTDTGVMKLSAGGFVTYSREDGVTGNCSLVSISEALDGELYAAGYTEDGHLNLYRRQGNGFAALQPKVPKRINYFGWRPARVILQDHAGEWWIISGSGLLRYPRLKSPAQLAQTPPKAIYTHRDGLPNDEVVRLYEDRRGDIWVGLGVDGVVVWNRAAERFETIAALAATRPVSFQEDLGGNMWMGDEGGRLWRIRNGNVSPVGGNGQGRGWINDILLDHAGRLWIATGSKGLLRLDQPNNPEPQIRSYDRREGLSSSIVRCLVEDRHGFIFAATGNGIDRLDPASGLIRRYTIAEGVPLGEIHAAYRDREGSLWFGDSEGLARLGTNDPPRRAAPQVWITGISIAGKPLPISPSGQANLSGLEIKPGEERVQFDFVALSYASGDVPRYQYRTGDGPWSQATQSRSVQYARLAPGRYQFAVRAINAEGDVSTAPAVVNFQVIPPVWQRLWFYALIASIVVGAAGWAHKLRVNKLLQLERLRLGIAADLHDDLGSSLSRIAVLSEVARRGSSTGEMGDALQRIGNLAREAIDSTSDIVWAVHPQKDHLSDLNRRMRHFSVDLLSVRNIAIRWKAPDMEPDPELSGSLRRHVYLIFKESMNNISRHSLATEASIELGLMNGELTLNVNDNGRGFDLSADGHGNGLKSMRARAAQLGGNIQLDSRPGAGTTISLRVPLHK